MCELTQIIVNGLIWWTNMIMIDSTHDYDELTSCSDLFFYLSVTAILPAHGSQLASFLTSNSWTTLGCPVDETWNNMIEARFSNTFPVD